MTVKDFLSKKKNIKIYYPFQNIQNINIVYLGTYMIVHTVEHIL